jgi:hypothetical protein
MRFGYTTVALCVVLTGCAPAQFSIIKAPTGKTPDQQTLDDTQCSQQSKVDGPWLYGVGTAIYWNMAKSRYRDCMTKQGYEVKEKN